MVAHERRADAAGGEAAGGYRRRVLVNFGSEAAGVPVDGRWTVEVAGGGEEAGEGSPYQGVVPGDAVVVLRSS